MAGFIDPSAPPMSGQTSSMVPSVPTTTVELTLRCSNLSDCDYLSKSDPVAIIFEKPKGSQHWIERWRSEMILNNLNPIWNKRFVHDYKFEEKQPLKIEIYDWDTNDQGVSHALKDQDLIGRLETNMASIVSSKQFSAVLRSKSNKGAGTCFITAEEVTSNKEWVKLQLGAKDLDKKDFFGKSDPFITISRMSPMDSQGRVSSTIVHQTDIVKNNLNPRWEPFKISLRELCNGDEERSIKFDVYDWDKDSENDLIGSFITTFAKMKIGLIEKTEFQVVHPEKMKKKKNYKNSGKVFLEYLETYSEPSFVDYLQGGLALNFSVAVDFTASNGDPQNPRSLHFLSQSGENQYTQAIKAVGEIIEPYDADKQFPGLGFGARIPPHGQVSFEFFLNLSSQPYCNGVQGVLDAYKIALQNVTLYGPTNFSPVINHVAQFAKAYQDGRQYFVLLILTDGAITDFDETKAAIVNASDLPMSIIIVGVGQEDFSEMEALDSDQGMLRAYGKVASRDIVQFVEMRKFSMSNGYWNQEGLAKEVLHEVPNQVVRWMMNRGLKPQRS